MKYKFRFCRGARGRRVPKARVVHLGNTFQKTS